MNSWSDLKADTHRQYGRFTACNLVKGFVTCRTFRVVVLMRFCQGIAQSRLLVRLSLPFFQLLYRIAASHAGMDLSWRTRIGGGLALTHGWGLVVNPGTRIGRNVTLFHGVTLGRRDRISHTGERRTGYPVIGDEVWIGPHAIIVGAVTIGRGCRIAGGAFVTEDTPPFSVVSGNPSAIVKNNCIPDVTNPAPDAPDAGHRKSTRL
jgi:serine O-acetyltransferase